MLAMAWYRQARLLRQTSVSNDDAHPGSLHGLARLPLKSLRSIGTVFDRVSNKSSHACLVGGAYSAHFAVGLDPTPHMDMWRGKSHHEERGVRACVPVLAVESMSVGRTRWASGAIGGKQRKKNEWI